MLEEKYKLVKTILDDHIHEQRQYTQKIQRDEKHRFGMPSKVIPVQAISVNTSRSVLKDIFMLEFYPTVSMVASIPAAIMKSHREMMHMFQPESVTGSVKLEISLVEEILKEWNSKKSPGRLYAQQTRKDVLSEVFIDDPMFVCEVGESMTALKDLRGII